MLEKQRFSQNSKLADVTTTYKKKDPNLEENYRPVSILHSVSKVFEGIIQKQIPWHINVFL